MVGQVSHHRKRRLRAQQLCGPSGDPGSGKVGGHREGLQSGGSLAASALGAAGQGVVRKWLEGEPL